MQQFSTIKKFDDEFSFKNFTQILEKNNIPYQTEVFRDRINPVTMVRLNPEFNVRVHLDKFELVNDILQKLANQELDQIDKSYFMFDFSNGELMEILEKPDEWAAINVQLAKKILKERGIEIDEEKVKSLKKLRIEELKKPEENSKINLWLGYFSAFCGGVLGIFIGWDLMNSMKVLPDGEKVFSYDEKDRSHGFKMAVLGTMMLIFWTIVMKETEDLSGLLVTTVWFLPTFLWLIVRFMRIKK